MANELVNGGMESDLNNGHDVLVIPSNGDPPYYKARGENLNPEGWQFWMVHGMPVEHDSNNKVGWAEPEGGAWKPGSLTPPRIRTGKGALKLFTFYRIHDAGIMQTLKVGSNKKVKASFWAHAWSSQDDDPKTSEGVGNSAAFFLEGKVSDDTLRNATYRVGIKVHSEVKYDGEGYPLLDLDPFEGEVHWGQGAHIYNAFAQVPALEVDLPDDAEYITIYVRSRYLWAFKHCDSYVDDISLEYIEKPLPPEKPTIPYGSKAGIHTIKPDGAENIVQRLHDAGARLPVVKAVNDLGYLSQIKANDPNVITIARITSSDEGLGNVVSDPDYPLAQAAEVVMGHIYNKISSDLSLADDVDYWEPVNEPAGGGVDADAYARIAEVMKLCMKDAEANGIKLALFSFNAGTPDWKAMEAIVATGVFEMAEEGGHILALHEGVWGSDMPIDECFGEIIEGAPKALEDGGCLIGRYKYFKLAAELGGHPFPPVVFTEFYYGGGYGGDPNVIIEERVRWVDENVYRPDDDVLAHCGFTWGPTTAWKNQDYGFMTDALVNYMIEVKDLENGTEPPEPEPKADGRPREPFDRVYVVLDPSRLSAEQMAEIIAGYWANDQFLTCGPSYDDAMMHFGMEYPNGDVNVHAIVYNWSKEEQPALLEFRDRWYPRATVEFKFFPDAPNTRVVHPIAGVHDEAGGGYIKDVGLIGACTVVPVVVRDQPVTLNFSHLHTTSTNMFVVCRLNWGYYPDGTLPGISNLDAHINAVIQTILRNKDKGISAWQLWNEPNNVGEHPRDFVLTREYVVNAYNRVFDGVSGSGAVLAPPPIDPYFGPGSDSRDWNKFLLANIHGAGLLITHAGKSQTNDTKDIWSDVKFQDYPLTWQYPNSKSLYTWMDDVPARLRHLPVMMGEVNPQHKYAIGGEVGWVKGNSAWVKAIFEFIRDWNSKSEHQIVKYACIYRWAYDAWGVSDDIEILSAIVKEGARYAG